MTTALALPLAVPAATFADEPLTDALWADLLTLAGPHWRETAPRHSADLPVAPQRDWYQPLADQGLLTFFTLRREGTLAGYCCVCVAEHQNHDASLQADVVAVYVVPEARGDAFAFLRWIDRSLAARRVSVVRHRVKLGRDWSPVLARMGYVPEETVWSRRLS